VTPRCYILRPYGVKPTESGKTIDFEHVQQALIKPAVELAGYEPVDFTEYISNAPIQDVVVNVVANSEAMIADITTRNVNVMYELGIRHAFVPTGTLIIDQKPLVSNRPFNLSNFFVHAYNYQSDGGDLKSEIERMARALKTVCADKNANAVYRKARYARDYEEYQTTLEQFQNVAPYERSIFVMTKYPNDDPRQQTDDDKKLERVINVIRKSIAEKGFVARLASDRRYHNTLWNNIEIYLLGCCKGVAIVENKYGSNVNPNVAMEWGWMRSAKKDVLYLLERDFKNERADFTGLLSEPFSWDFPEQNIEAAIDRWLSSTPRVG
jgi:hypothetical protein